MSAVLPESFFYIIPSLVSSFITLWPKIQKVCPKNPVGRSLDGFQPGMRAVSDALNTAPQRKVTAFFFDVNGKRNAAAVMLSNLWQSTEGISPLEKQAQTRHRVVLVMSQHVLDVITTNTSRSGAEKLKNKKTSTNIFSSTVSWKVAFESHFKWFSGDTFLKKKKSLGLCFIWLLVSPFFCVSQPLPHCEAFSAGVVCRNYPVMFRGRII